MSAYRVEYTVTVNISRDGGDTSSSSAELEGRYELSWSTRDAIADALEELTQSLRDQGDD